MNERTPEILTRKSSDKVWLQCPVCRNDFQAVVCNCTRNGTWCCSTCQALIRNVMNDRGSSTEKSNVLEAVKIGVELGFANPHYLLGKMLLRGLCVEKDIIEGVRHLEAAVKMGHAKAQEIKEFLETFRR